MADLSQERREEIGATVTCLQAGRMDGRQAVSTLAALTAKWLDEDRTAAAEVIARIDDLAEWWEAHTQFAAPRYVGEQFRRAARGEQTTDQIVRAARNGGGSDV